MSGEIGTIAILGGTGAEGSGLAVRWAAAGYRVVIGSRDPAKALAVARDLVAPLDHADITGTGLADAAAAGDLVVLAVPFAAQLATARAVADRLAGQILVDVTVPLAPPQVDRVRLPNGRSAVEQLQEALGDSVTVVAAFQNISAHHLKDLDWQPDCDVLICGDTKDARETVLRLAEAAGFRGIHAGMLQNAAAVEAMTSVLIAINKRYKVAGSGLRITGLG